MQAIILNSGIGSRLGKYTQNKPKCMVELNYEETILSYQLNLLYSIGIRDVIITTGYMQDRIIDYVEKLNLNMNFTWVYNENYFNTNYIVSLNKVSDLQDDVIIMHGDLVFSEDVLKQLMKCKKSGVIVDTTQTLPQKDFKAVVVNGKVEKIGIQYFGEKCVTLQPLYYLQKEDWLLWKREIKGFCEQGKTNVYAEEAFNHNEKLLIDPIDIKGDFCSEIDNEEDLMKVRKQLYG